MPDEFHHRWLECGVELAVLPMPGRRTAAFEIRVLAGLVDEPAEKLGLARVVEDTLDKGTASHTARQFSDALDAIGAQTGSSVGRESFVFRCNCLPEHVPAALALHAGMIRTPAFPDEFCRVSLDLMQQELTALEDEPGELARKLLGPHAYGPVLGRHELGSRDTLRAIARDDVLDFWRRNFAAGRMQLAIGGAVRPGEVADLVEKHFSGFGAAKGNGRAPRPVEFTPGRHHQPKELEQEHILICWPGLAIADDAYYVENLVLAMLSDGMSSRLFVEVREKLGLVYWVGAWDEHPRGAGMIFLGASTTPARCEQTYRTLLREVDRLGEDVTDAELERARVGIIARTQTHGDITRARVGELGGDLFHHGRPVPIEEKHARLRAVTIRDVRDYLDAHPRQRLCVQTLGPVELTLDGGA
jgi:predicted Zn-dependent peptidase